MLKTNLLHCLLGTLSATLFLVFDIRYWPTRHKTARKSSYLYDIHGGCTGTTNVYGDRFHQGGPCKVLDLLRHCGWEQKGLTLPLNTIKQY